MNAGQLTAGLSARNGFNAYIKGRQLVNVEVMRRNNVQVSGQGSQTLIFAAGFGCDQNMWRYVAPAFAEHYRIVLFDYVGSGKSDLRAYDPAKYNGLNGYVRDLIEVLEAVEAERATFVGHSVGCMIGLLASIERPELFERMVLIGPSPCYLNEASAYEGGFERDALEGLFELMDKNYIGWANYLAPVVMKNSDRPELAGELQESFCSTDPVIARNFARVTFFSDNRQDLPRVSVPALILQCAEDAIAPTQVGEYMHQHLPQSELRYMKATGHCPHMSHPEETLELMKDYLQYGAVTPVRGREPTSAF